MFSLASAMPHPFGQTSLTGPLKTDILSQAHLIREN